MKISFRPTYSAITSTLALVVALSTAGYAAVTLEKNSVGSPQIKKGAVHASDLGKNAVRSKNVKDGSLRADDFKAAELPSGPQGPQGPQGLQGPQGVPGAGGSALAYATVIGDGSILPDSAKNLTAANVDPDTETGVYCYSFPGQTIHTAVVSPLPNGFGASDFIASVFVSPTPSAIGSCAGQVIVVMEQVSPAGRADWSFNLVVE